MSVAENSPRGTGDAEAPPMPQEGHPRPLYPLIGHPDEAPHHNPPRRTPPPPFSVGEAMAHPQPHRQHSFSAQDMEKQAGGKRASASGGCWSASRRRCVLLLGLLLLGIILGSVLTVGFSGYRKRSKAKQGQAAASRRPTPLPAPREATAPAPLPVVIEATRWSSDDTSSDSSLSDSSALLEKCGTPSVDSAASV